MALNNINPTTTNAWTKLTEHYNNSKNLHLKELFSSDDNRAEKFSKQWNNFLLDFSKNRITGETLDLLLDLANEVDLKGSIIKYFSGDKINQTEGRAVLHTALRAKETDEVFVDGKNVVEEVYEVKKHIKEFSKAIIEGENKGYSGKPFTDVVNIGIGGSDLGPAMVTEALKFYKNHLNVHFVSNGRWRPCT